ncbi:hypothetical protein D3C85_1774930 [compost metagenome]
MDDYHIASIAVIDQWENGRVAHIAAIPVVLPVDRDCLEQCRHTGRSKHRFGADILTREDAYLSCFNIGRA